MPNRTRRSGYLDNKNLFINYCGYSLPRIITVRRRWRNVWDSAILWCSKALHQSTIFYSLPLYCDTELLNMWKCVQSVIQIFHRCDNLKTLTVAELQHMWTASNFNSSVSCSLQLKVSYKCTPPAQGQLTFISTWRSDPCYKGQKRVWACCDCHVRLCKCAFTYTGRNWDEITGSL
jgi:hypothetical protein